MKRVNKIDILVIVVICVEWFPKIGNLYFHENRGKDHSLFLSKKGQKWSFSYQSIAASDISQEFQDSYTSLSDLDFPVFQRNIRPVLRKICNFEFDVNITRLSATCRHLLFFLLLIFWIRAIQIFVIAPSRITQQETSFFFFFKGTQRVVMFLIRRVDFPSKILRSGPWLSLVAWARRHSFFPEVIIAEDSHFESSAAVRSYCSTVILNPRLSFKKCISQSKV